MYLKGLWAAMSDARLSRAHLLCYLVVVGHGPIAESQAHLVLLAHIDIAVDDAMFAVADLVQYGHLLSDGRFLRTPQRAEIHYASDEGSLRPRGERSEPKPVRTKVLSAVAANLLKTQKMNSSSSFHDHDDPDPDPSKRDLDPDPTRDPRTTGDHAREGRPRSEYPTNAVADAWCGYALKTGEWTPLGVFGFFRRRWHEEYMVDYISKRSIAEDLLLIKQAIEKLPGDRLYWLTLALFDIESTWINFKSIDWITNPRRYQHLVATAKKIRSRVKPEWKANTQSQGVSYDPLEKLNER